MRVYGLAQPARGGKSLQLGGRGPGAGQPASAEQLALDLGERDEDWHAWFVALPAGVYSSVPVVRPKGRESGGLSG
jgi:hypothetical protein